MFKFCLFLSVYCTAILSIAYGSGTSEKCNDNLIESNSKDSNSCDHDKVQHCQDNARTTAESSGITCGGNVLHNKYDADHNRVEDKVSEQENRHHYSYQENKDSYEMQQNADDHDVTEEDETEEDEEEEFSPGGEESKQVTRILNIGDGDSAWVIDNAVPRKVARSLSRNLESLTYQYGYTFMHKNYSVLDSSEDWNFGSSPWAKQINISLLNETLLWKNMQPMIENILDGQVKLQYSQLELLRSLDALPPSEGKYCKPNRYVLTIFLNRMWNLNNYGQISFYTKQSFDGEESRYEITETVHPHPFRLLVWPSCHPVLFRAPCVNYFRPLKYLNIWLTKNLDDFEDFDTQASHAKPFNVQVEEFSKFRFTNPDADRKIDFEKHLVRTFNDGDENRQVHIFDDLFTIDEMRQWRQHLLKTDPRNSPFDSSALEDHDNVQWAGFYDIYGFMKTDMWPRLLALCHFVSNESDWHPYDVAINYVRSADHTRIHPDSENHQLEWTMVMYVSEGLQPSHTGETTFFIRKPDDGVHQFTGPGGELYEAIGTVMPKFGRVAIFRNNIEHSAHPPSIEFLGGRYTFAVKVSRNKHLALVKMVYERMERLDLDEKMQLLSSKLENGQLDDPKLIPTSTLENVFEKLGTQIMADQENDRIKAFRSLTQDWA